jgi:uncharacterized protein
MNEVDLIRALGDLDRELDRLQKERDQLAARGPETQAALADAQAALARAEAALGAIREEERAAARDVGLYEKRRAAASRALSEGLGDPDAAQRQVEQCAAILDDLETRQLELMESAEAASGVLTAARSDRDTHARAAAAVEAELPPGLAAIDAARAAVQPDRDAARAALPKELGLRYDLVRTKKRTAVAELRPDDTCLGCRLRAPTVEAADARRGLLRACRGCGRFLIPPPV